MNYSQLPSANGMSPQSLGQNAVGFISTENIDGKWLTLFRPNPWRIHDKEFMALFRTLGESTAGITHPCVLRPATYVEDERGGYYAFGSTRYVTLGQFLQENPGMVADATWTDSLLDDLLAALADLNAHNQAAVELTAVSVLVARSGTHRLMLMPPLASFLPRRRDVWTQANEALAPELLSDDEETALPAECTPGDLARLDLYGAARTMERIFRFSEVPHKLQTFIGRCTSDAAAKRPASVAQARTTLRRSARRQSARNWAATALMALLIVGLIAWGLSGGSEKDFREVNRHALDSLSRTSSADDPFMADIELDMDDPAEIFVRDTTFLIEDTAISLSPERRAAEKQRMEKAIVAYRKQYERVARAILTPVYTPHNLHGDKQTFLLLATQAMQKLQDLAISMQKQYQLDPTTAEAEAGDIIEKVTNELKDQANAMP